MWYARKCALSFTDLMEKMSLRTFQIDPVLEHEVKEIGLWQWTIVILLTINSNVTVVFPVFANTKPAYRCRMEPEIEAILATYKNVTFYRISELVGPVLNTIPVNTYTSSNIMSGCWRYQRNWSVKVMKQLLIDNPTPMNNTYETCPFGYVYHYTRDQYPSSIVSEWNLVCDNSWMSALSTTVYMIGMFIGLCGSGFFCDRYGRRWTLIISSCAAFVLGMAVSLSTRFVYFIIFRGGLGALSMANLSITMVFFMEITIPRRRSTINCFWGVSVSIFRVGAVMLAYLIPNWRYLHFGMVAQGLICLLFFSFLPESPRWLLARGHTDEALKVLYKGYLMNNFNIYTSTTKDTLNFDEFCSAVYASQENLPAVPQINQAKLRKKLGVFGTRRLILLTLTGAVIYAGQSATHFGLIFYARTIRSSIYLAAFLNAILGIPGTLFSSILYRYCPTRRTPLFVIYITCFAILLIESLYALIAKPDSDAGLVITTNIVLVLVAASFNMLYVYIPELYPPELRTQGLGFSAGLGRVGGVFCDFINHLEYTMGHAVPIVFYCGFTLLASVAVCFIPDTTGEDNYADKLKQLKKKKRENQDNLI